MKNQRKMKINTSLDSIIKIDEESSEMNLGIKPKLDKKSRRFKKRKEKMFTKNNDELTISEKKLMNYKNNNSIYKFVGNSIFLFMDKNDDPLLIIGPEWPLIACLFSLFNFFYLMIIIKFWNQFSLSNKLVNQISYWIYMISLLYTSLINQGYPKNDEGRRNGYPKNEYYFCGQCHFYIKKTVFTFHCNKCGICIEGQDHHCAWVGKCIGKNNSISFYIFLVSTIFSVFYILLAFTKIFKY